MKVSAISQNPAEDCRPRRNLFIQYSNSFMSVPQANLSAFEKANASNPKEAPTKPEKMGIEKLEELESFTIFPKQVVDGKTIITA